MDLQSGVGIAPELIDGSIGDTPVDGGIAIGAGSTLHIFATEISVDGIPLPLLIAETVEIDRVDGALIAAILEDGSGFSFEMNIWS